MRITLAKNGLRWGFILMAVGAVFFILTSSGLTRSKRPMKESRAATSAVRTAITTTSRPAPTTSPNRVSPASVGNDILSLLAGPSDPGTNRLNIDGLQTPTANSNNASPQLSNRPEITAPVTPIKMNKDLRELPYIPPGHQGFELPEFHRHPRPETEESSNEPSASKPFEAIRELLAPQPGMPALNLNFDGIDRAAGACNCSPPDTVGDVGSNYYIQMVNSGVFQVWNKTGNVLLATTTLTSLWGTGGTNPCTQGEHFGDPIPFYDQLADRWILTDFAFGLSGPNTVAPYYQCVAISQTSNPVSGGWYLYPFQHDPVNTDWLGDYPKYGMWPDAYYTSYNMFCGAASCTFGGRNSFQGVQVEAVDRTVMLTGAAVSRTIFRLTPAQLGDTYTLLPASFRFGTPPVGRNEFFASIDSPPVAQAFSTLTKVHVYKFHFDAAVPGNSTFTTTPTDITVNGFTNAWDSTENAAIVPQSGTTVKLDTVGDRLFANLIYQNLGGIESLWATHTINATSTGNPTAVRWYQFDVTGNTVAGTPVYQGDITGGLLYRWMPSLNVDKSGNMAIGYSVSSASTFPSISYNGRLTTDAANTLGQGESTIIIGTGPHTASTRWGDYSATSIDPTDGCTFWHTNEYMLAASATNWKTRVAAFAYPQCIAANDGTLSGTVTDSISSLPISGVAISATSGGITRGTSTNGSGVYTLNILPGTYDLTAVKTGYTTGVANGKVVTVGNTTVQNFVLVSNCSPVARMWVGAGAGGVATDFNAAGSWSPAGVPQPCDNLTMTLTSGATINLIADSTINNLTTSVGGTNNIFRLNAGTNTLTINGTTSANVTSGNNNTQLQFNVGNSPGQIIYGGDATFAAAAGGPITFPILGVGNTTGQVVFRGNATFNAGAGTSSSNLPAKVIFDKAGTQTITDNAGTAIILLGATSTEIGSTNSPTVVVAGSASNFQPQGNLNVNGTSVLDLSTKTFNRSAAGGTFTLAAGATLKLGAGTGGQTGSNFPLNFTTNTLNATSTVDYNGTVAQTVFATPPYGHLTLTGAATKTAGAGLTVNGNLTINVGATFAASTFSHNFKGNWINSGSFTSSGTSTFSGTAAETITGATTFNNLTLANTSGGIDATAANTNLTVTGTLNMTQGTDLNMGANVLIMGAGSAAATTGTGQGEVVGKVRRTSFASGASYSFGSPFVQFGSFTFTGAPTQIDVTLTQGTPDTFVQAVRRTYDIAVTGGTITSTVLRLHYRDDVNSLNGNSEGSLTLWKGPTWTDQGFTTRNATDNWVEKSGVNSFSPWTLANSGSAPTAVTLTKFNAASFMDGVQLNWESGFEVNNLGYHLYREQNGKRTRVTSSFVAGSALSVGQGNKLTAGYSYTWFDPQGTADTSYWLESIDLNGGRQWAGPTYPYAGAGKQLSARHARALLLGELACANSVASRSLANGSSKGWPAAQSSDRWSASSPRLQSSSLSTQQDIAAGPAVKIAINGSGWYRLTRDELTATGFDLSGDARLLQLYVDGQQVPVRLSGDGSHFNSTDSLEFFAVGIDTPTTGTRVYYLIKGTSSGLRITEKREKVRPWENWTAGARSFQYTTERRDKVLYASHLLNGDAENIFGAPIFSEPTSQALTVRNSERDAAGPAQLEVTLQGFTSQQHEVDVQLNGTPLGIVSFKDVEHPTAIFTVNRSVIHDGENTVSLVATNGDADISFVDSLRLTYAHRYFADNNALSFSVPAGEVVHIDGFTTPDVRVIDVTNPDVPVELITTAFASENGYAVRVQTNTNGARTFLAFVDELAAHAASVTANAPSTWHEATNGADFVIITYKDFRQAIEPLANLRRSEGLSVAVVDVEDVYDEYSYGVHTPAALKAFVMQAAASWSRKPTYLLLVGDSSWDPRDYLGEGYNDFVPTKLIDTGYMETSSDDWLADFADSGEANLAIGRLPARTSAEVSLMVSKIVAYQQERELNAPLRGAVMVADNGFESISTQTQSLLPVGIAVETINRSALGSDDVMRGHILDALNEGPMMVNYYGHGSVRVWTGAGVLDADLAAGLTNVSKPSLFVLMTCLNGYASDAYVDSLGEAALKSQNGAVGVWASSGFTDSEPQFVMNQEFYRILFGTSPVRLGEAARRAKTVIADYDVRRTWVLLGDPTMLMR
jgi:hypothetical protein